MMVSRIQDEVTALQDIGANGHFYRYLDRVRPEVNARIKAHLTTYSRSGMAREEVLRLFSQGKRLRAGLAILTYDLFADRYDRRDAVLDMAAAIEIAHSASLILDDMLDGDEERRGQRSLHLTNGRKKALLEMVGSLSIPYAIAARHGPVFVAELAQTHRAMVDGALMEIQEAEQSSSYGVYERIITEKTAELFSLAARHGATMAGEEEDLIDTIAQFGLEVGRVMQLADDIADLRRPEEDISENGSEKILYRYVHGLTQERLGTDRPERDTADQEMDRYLAMVEDRVHSARALVQPYLKRPSLTLERGALVRCLLDAPWEIADMMLRGL